MFIRRFFSDSIADNNPVSIVSEEFYHLVRVLRKREGDRIELFDGKGSLASGEISAIEKNRAIISIRERFFKEKSSVKTVICPSLLKRRAMDLMIEKLSEMGIHEIRPVIFDRTDVRFKSESLKRWKKISLESLKVNGKLWPTVIFNPVTPDKILEYAGEFRSRIIFDISGKKTGILPGFPSIAVIGPPGDFTDRERSYLQKGGFTSININDAIMKSETAAISAGALMKMFLTMEENGK